MRRDSRVVMKEDGADKEQMDATKGLVMSSFLRMVAKAIFAR